MEILDDTLSASFGSTAHQLCENSSESPLIAMLLTELALQKQKTRELSQKISTERKRNVRLKSRIDKVLTQEQSDTKLACLEDAIRRVKSAGSIKQLMTSAYIIPKTASKNSFAVPKSPCAPRKIPKLASCSQ